MNNHSDIWKNITMIIFFIILLLLSLIVFIKFKVNIYLEINGTKCFVKINFWLFEIKRNGSLRIKKKKCNENKNGKKIKGKTRKTKSKYKNFVNKIIQRKRNKTLFNLFIKNITRLQFDKLEIYEKIGVLEPTITAYAVPVISTLTMLPLNLLQINYSNFKYKIIPEYTDLKFNLILKTQISFKLMNIFNSIIAEKMRKLYIRNI